MKKVSIILTTYNGALFIVEQLDSILKQTMPPDEVLIFDDQSKDNTCDLVRSFIEEHILHNSWRLIINQQNKGYARNFMESAMSASGDYVFFCDQDDIWMVDKIEKMSTVLDCNTDVNLLCSNLEPFYYDEDTRRWDPKELKAMTNDGSIERHHLTPSDFHIKRSGCTMCVRKDFLNGVFKYWQNNWAHDDFLWKTSVLSDSCAIYQYTSLKRRMHKNNTSVLRNRTRKWRIDQLKERLHHFESLLKYAEDIGLDEEQMTIIKKNIQSVKMRIDTLENRRIANLPILVLKYRDCYPRKKGLYLDAYLTMFDTYKGAN